MSDCVADCWSRPRATSSDRSSEGGARADRHSHPHSSDLMVRCQLGPDHDKHHWAARKRALTAESSSRWAGAITKRSNDVWATTWQSQTRHAASLWRAIRTLEQRLARPVGSHGTRRTMAGYRGQAERHEKQRRLQILRAELDRLDAELHLGHLANRPRRRYRLSCLARFQHRGEDWAAQIAVGAVAYAIWFSPERRRWYLDASWTKAPSPPVTLERAAPGKGRTTGDQAAQHRSGRPA
jgi:hypothetical protein